LGPGESRHLTTALLVLTFATGIVDAASFLGLGAVFAAMQTGNVIFLGLGIAGAAGAPVVAPLVALVSFLGGGAVAALLIRRPPGRMLALGVLVECSLLAAATVLSAAADPDPGTTTAYFVIAALSVAMGVRNTLARRVGGENLATTVLNLTMAAFTTASPSNLASGADLSQRVAGFAAILAGAVTGALLVKTDLALALAAATAVTLAAGLLQLRARAVELSPA